jgi:hypothetical protein
MCASRTQWLLSVRLMDSCLQRDQRFYDGESGECDGSRPRRQVLTMMQRTSLLQLYTNIQIQKEIFAYSGDFGSAVEWNATSCSCDQRLNTILRWYRLESKLCNGFCLRSNLRLAFAACYVLSSDFDSGFARAPSSIHL